MAKNLVRDALSGRFYSTVGIESFMLTTLCAGMGPLVSFGDFCAQVIKSPCLYMKRSRFLFFYVIMCCYQDECLEDC